MVVIFVFLTVYSRWALETVSVQAPTSRADPTEGLRTMMMLVGGVLVVWLGRVA